MTRNQKYYQRGKDRARSAAIDWQMGWESGTERDQWSCSEWTAFFRRVGKRFGLLREFYENGII